MLAKICIRYSFRGRVAWLQTCKCSFGATTSVSFCRWI